MTIPETRSGRRSASTLAKLPPRLWPDDRGALALLARRGPRAGPRAARRAAPEQSTFARMPALLGRWPVRRSQRVMSAASRRRPGSPGSAARAGRGRPRRPRPGGPGRAERCGLEADPRFPPERRPGTSELESVLSPRVRVPEVGRCRPRPHVYTVVPASNTDIDRAGRIVLPARARRDHPGRRARGRGAPRPRARERARCSCACEAAGHQRGGHAPAQGRLPGPARRRRRTSRASSWPARWRRSARAPPASRRATG